MCESRARGGSYAGIPGKMAQLRLYPRVLFPAEIAIVHSESAWPSGGTMRQCATMQDESFYDSNDVDSRGHSCAWFRSVPLTCTNENVCGPTVGVPSQEVGVVV